MPNHYRSALIAVLLAPTLVGMSCEPDVPLGGSPDSGTTPGSDAGPMADSGAPTSDAGPTDAGPPGSGAITLRAQEMLIDVFDGATSSLSFRLDVTIEDATTTMHDVRPRRYELLASDGSVLLDYPLSGAPARLDGSDSGVQRYQSFEVAPRDAVAAPLTRACAEAAIGWRFLTETIRIVVDVDGREQTHEQSVPSGTGGLPPWRPFVLCHDGVRVMRSYEGFHNGFVGFRLRPDGLYDVEIWESSGGAMYTNAPVRTIDPDVRISPMMGRHWPSIYTPFTATMDAFPCPSCPVGGAMNRYIAGSPTVPMQIPTPMAPYWCGEPAPGQDDGIPWRPAVPSGGSWTCRVDGTILSGDGGGVVRFTGTTDAGPFGVEMFLFGAVWNFDETHLP